MSNKYELTQETIKVDGRTLYRIRALRNLEAVKAGELGGFIESEDNLSNACNCWVFGNAQVFETARISGNARISENAQVSGNAYVHGTSKIFGNAKIYGDAQVRGNACVYGYAQVYGYAYICDEARVFGRARIFGNAQIGGDTWMCGDDAQISGGTWISRDSQLCKDPGTTNGSHNHSILAGLQVGDTSDASTTLKIGDVVTLNSGSPNMTIVCTLDEYCDCTWFLNGIEYTRRIRIECLKKT